MEAKLRKISKRLNPYGGICFVQAELRRKGLREMFDAFLGKRVRQARFSFGDVMESHILANMCGAKRLEDTKKLQAHLQDLPNTKCPSPVRTAGIFKSLAVQNEIIKTKTDRKEKALYEDHELNYNPRMNSLLIKTGQKLKMIGNDPDQTLDYDNVTLFNEKIDSRYTYKVKNAKGYCPGVAFIGKAPVYVEGRSGNSSAGAQLVETLNRMFDLLKDHNVPIGRFRSDSAAYDHKIFAMLDMRGIDFFIRAKSLDTVLEDMGNDCTWQTSKRDKDVSYTSWDYSSKGTKRKYRYAIRRSVSETKNKITGEGYDYIAIITNNVEMEEEEMFKYYAQRGNIENNFASLLNDFNWRRVPFSYLNYNTVFMIMTAIAFVVYGYILRTFSLKVDFVRITYELKAFVDNFISVVLEWMTEGQQKIPILHTEKCYEKLEL